VNFPSQTTLILTFTEAILETTVDDLQVSHATSTGGLSSLALFGPVDYKKNR
jgi:hypothetical protein